MSFTMNFLLIYSFNTQPHEGGCNSKKAHTKGKKRFNTQPHEGGCVCFADLTTGVRIVSTHSRTKAAAAITNAMSPSLFSFNTQPHEGGCSFTPSCGVCCLAQFQHTAARRRLPCLYALSNTPYAVSTHSRTKAAAGAKARRSTPLWVSTHSRTKAAACLKFSFKI